LKGYRNALEHHQIDSKALLALKDSWLDNMGIEIVVRNVNQVAAYKGLPVGDSFATCIVGIV
jgi:hypothetical protein